MAYLLDTNIAIHARDGDDVVLEKLVVHDGAILISALTLADLERGIYKNPAHSGVRRMRLQVLIRHIPVVPFDAAAARAYGQIIAQCGWVKGRDYDRMIAAHAIATASVLVTNNVADFSDIPGLSLENWMTKDAQV